MKTIVVLTGLLALCLCPLARAQSGGVFGLWQEPTGSVVRIGPCGKTACIWIAVVSPRATAVTDIHNPEARLRSRPLCGLKIGDGFALSGVQQASDGTLYDPKSGHTYHGEMKVMDSDLHLRGYIGFSIFGRTEVWKRPAEPVAQCPAAPGSH